MIQFYGLDRDTSLGGQSSSDNHIPSQKSVKTYVDSKTSSLNYDAIVGLDSDETMDNIMGGEDYYNINIVLSSDASRTITVDRMGSNENYFILSNRGSVPITYTFDFTGSTQYIFIGNPEYACSDQKLIVSVPAGSNMMLTFRPLNTTAIGFEVMRMRASGTTSVENLENDDVALILENRSTGVRSFLEIGNYYDYAPDLSNYNQVDSIRIHRGKNGREVVMHKNETSGMWSEYNRYRLYCTMSSAGSFTWSVSINGTAKGGTVTWGAGDTLDSIVNQLNEGAVSTYLVFSHVSGEDFVRIRKGGWQYSVFSISVSSGTATLEDLSKYVKIGGVTQFETHRDWQTTDVASMFPGYGFLSATSVQYARNGLNLSYRCGVHYDRFRDVYRNGGSSSYISEGTLSSRMSASGFAAMNGSGNADAQALYDKYSGSWDAYMLASMLQLDDAHTNGIEYLSYDNGDTQNAFLASVTTMDFDGNWIPAFPAAYRTSLLTDSVYGAYHLPTNHEIGVFMDVETMRKINLAMSVVNGTPLTSTGKYYWSVAQYYSYGSWLFNQDTGCLDIGVKYYDFTCRGLAYIN